MRITMLAVISQDGFLTRSSDPNPSSWASKEDQEQYRSTIDTFPLLIMGNTTYQVSKSSLPLRPHKIVLTRQHRVGIPSKNTQFTNAAPKELKKETSQNFATALLIGGAETYLSFLRDGCIDEIILTVEPLELQHGVRLFHNWQKELTNFRFRFVDSKQLNRTGTKVYRLIYTL